MKYMNRIFTPFLLFVIFFAAPGCFNSKKSAVSHAFKNFKGPYVIYVTKKAYTLEVFDRNMRAVESYRIALGKNPDLGPKRYEGDNRTPEGTYHIAEILSMDAEKKSPAYRKLKQMNNVFFKASHGHHRFGRPGVDLGENAYGPRFFMIDYPLAKDLKEFEKLKNKGLVPDYRGRKATAGSGIAIHGNNEPESIGNPASSGCIRMLNDDIVEMDQYIRIGTPVIISP